MDNEIENDTNPSQQVWLRGKIWVEIEPIGFHPYGLIDGKLI